MRADGPVGDGKSKPRASLFISDKGLKDMGKMLFRDAAAGVFYGDNDLCGCAGCVQPDSAGPFDGFPGVAKEIQKYFPQLDAVPLNDREIRGQTGCEFDRTVGAGGRKRQNDLLHKGAERKLG